MKQITKDTILKQGDKSYPAIQTEQGILWIDKDAEIRDYNYHIPYLVDGKIGIYDNHIDWTHLDCPPIIAANFELEGVPKIELKHNNESSQKGFDESLWENYRKPLNRTMSHLERDAFIADYKANQAKYTEEDMANFGQWIIRQYTIYTNRDENFAERMLPEYIQSINSIKEITVDENFKQN